MPTVRAEPAELCVLNPLQLGLRPHTISACGLSFIPAFNTIFRFHKYDELAHEASRGIPWKNNNDKRVGCNLVNVVVSIKRLWYQLSTG